MLSITTTLMLEHEYFNYKHYCIEKSERENIATVTASGKDVETIRKQLNSVYEYYHKKFPDSEKRINSEMVVRSKLMLIA